MSILFALVASAAAAAVGPVDAAPAPSVVAVKVALSLDAEGRITGCRAADEALSPDYTDKVCPSFAARGKMRPPMDEAGNPVAGVKVMTVRYRGE